METIINITTRRSIRRFEDRPISEKDVQTVLEAAMSGPTCVNSRDWQFIVVENKEILDKMAQANGPYAAPLCHAAIGILICGDLNKAYCNAKDYWIIDGAIAGQNISLAARALGIGSVWLGTWPEMDRVQKQVELFNLPQNVVPHSIIALGYSKETANTESKNNYDELYIHREKW